MSTSSDDHETADDLQAFLRAWLTFQEVANRGMGQGTSALRSRVTEHLGVDPDSLESASATMLVSEAVNQHLAIEALDSSGEVLGLHPEIGNMGPSVNLHSMLSSMSHVPNEIMPITWTEHPIDVGERRRFPVAGLWLLTVDDSPVVLGLWSRDARRRGPEIFFEVLAEQAEVAHQTLERLEELRTKHNVYRGKILGFTFSEFGEFGLEFLAPADVPRDNLILPAEDLAAIEKHTIGIAAKADQLRSAGKHLKRGLLLYGPPGTGKTHTVSYLIGAMPGRTTIILQGHSAGAIGQAAAIARAFPPATIVIEDVDLIAYDRGMHRGDNPLLFQLLNEMDGFADDSDLLFLLTTNRADILEPALASRPGRIDQAVEVARPDQAARVRLLELYLGDSRHAVGDLSSAAARLRGVTASFIKELSRRAFMNAIDAEAVLDDDTLHTTITEQLQQVGPHTHGLVDRTDGTSNDMEDDLREESPLFGFQE